MPVITLPFGPLEANCHIVHNGVDAVVFDPSDDTALIQARLSEKGFLCALLRSPICIVTTASAALIFPGPPVLSRWWGWKTG